MSTKKPVALDVTAKSSFGPAPAMTAPWQLRWQLRFSERRLLLMIGDVIASALAVGIALAIWMYQAHSTLGLEFVLRQLVWFVMLPCLWWLLAAANDFYNLAIASHVWKSLLRMVQISAQLLFTYLLIFFLSPPGSLPRLFIAYYAGTSLVLLGIWRACRLAVIGWSGQRRRVVIVGAGGAGQMIVTALQEEALADYEIVGYVTSSLDEIPSAHQLEGVPYLGLAKELPQIVRRRGVAEIVMAYVNDIPSDAFQGVLAGYEQGANVMPMLMLYEQISGRIPVEHVGENLWAHVLAPPPHVLAHNFFRLAKRLVDVLMSFVVMLLFLLLLPLLALAIKIDSRGPVFYKQTRLGRGGRPFQIIKLRTMRMDAESASGPRWAQRGDPRITRLGRILRRTRLDEIPQIINVLRGEMSIVGPRPERPEFVDMLTTEIPFYRARLVVKPGLTGWAQVRYRYGSSVEDALRKLQYDLYYIRHQSFLLDLLIMFRTVATVVLFKGT
jgi:exopolysaccharide biosynthesis polyprenyl glycosylphosphotransferase